MSDSLVAIVDSVIRIPPDLPRNFTNDLKRKFTHSNPDYYKKMSMGFSTYGTDTVLKTFDDTKSGLLLPRGGTDRLREVCSDYGVRIKFVDRRTTCEVDFPRFVVDPDHPDWVLRDYQIAGINAALKYQQGIIRSSTGSGKTKAALALIFEVGQRALVIMRDGNLLKQWLGHVYRSLGLSKNDVAMIGGGKKYQPGRPITLALQQTLYKRIDEYKKIFKSDPFGITVIDECQGIGAYTYLKTIREIPTKYRIGFSADERRSDKKEFLIYDSMGKVIHETMRQDLEKSGYVHPVTIRIVETNFAPDWYLSLDPLDRDFRSLIDEMIDDEERNLQIVRLMKKLQLSGEIPAVVFSGRRNHVRKLALNYLQPNGFKTGMLLGGVEDSRRFQIDKDALMNSNLDICVATYQSFGQGHDVPVVRSGICATPISKNNSQFFGQVRGRLCRKSESTGKTEAFLYYMLDTKLFPNYIRNLENWNDGNVEVFYKNSWVSYSSVR